MFEQSILLDHATGRKTGALAASIAAQTLAAGLLIFIPLLYNNRLPGVRAWTPLMLPLPVLPPAPEVAPAETPSPSTRTSLPAPRVFHLPTATARPLGPVVVDAAAPSIEASALPQGVPSGIGLASLPRVIDVSPPPVAPPAAPRASEKPRPVGGDVQAARLIRKVVPAYPSIARQARVSGTVRLIGIIARDGTIQRLEVESGPPLLVRAALDAVRQWIYRPTLLNGEAIEVIAPIDVIFTLSQ